jgi:hypothetical protein
MGPSGEDRTYVDVQYRSYSDAEIDAARSDATPLEYRTLFRDIESYVGEYVTYTGTIIQTLEGEGASTFLIALNDDPGQLVYASWTGGRFLSEDRVTIWAEVLGTEIYESGRGSENTVPAFAIADMQMAES